MLIKSLYKLAIVYNFPSSEKIHVTPSSKILVTLLTQAYHKNKTLLANTTVL